MLRMAKKNEWMENEQYGVNDKGPSILKSYRWGISKKLLISKECMPDHSSQDENRSCGFCFNNTFCYINIFCFIAHNLRACRCFIFWCFGFFLVGFPENSFLTSLKFWRIGKTNTNTNDTTANFWWKVESFSTFCQYLTIWVMWCIFTIHVWSIWNFAIWCVRQSLDVSKA